MPIPIENSANIHQNENEIIHFKLNENSANADLFQKDNKNKSVTLSNIALIDITSIDNYSNADIHLVQSPIPCVTVEGMEDEMQKVHLQVYNKTLKITSDPAVTTQLSPKIYVSLPYISSCKIKGNGSLIGLNLIQLGELFIEIYGSGDAKLSLCTKRLKLISIGSGNLILNGKTDDLYFTLEGSGDLRGYELEATNALILSKGSGKTEVSVLNRLQVEITGSGNVKYNHDPYIIDYIIGSGRLINEN